jgi:hypothetical protein
VGKKANLKFINGINTYASFPYDSLKKEMKIANQIELLKSMEEFPLSSTSKSLTARLLDLNTAKSRKENRSWYIKYANRGGDTDNFVGAYLTAEWFRRNLYMYQKLTDTKDNMVT